MNVSIESPTVGIYGSQPLLINTSIISNVTILGAMALINATTPFNIEVNISDDYSSPDQGDVIIEFSNNPSLFNATMVHITGVTWRFSWSNISSYANGVYRIQIHANDSSLGGNSNSSLIFSLTVSLSPARGFDLIAFLTSPLGLIMMGGIAAAIIAITVVMLRRRGHRTSEEERVRIGRLTGESLCEKCMYFDIDSSFCNKLLVIKRFDLNAPCKEFKIKNWNF